MNTLFIIFSGIFGACFGSFITMASYRLPKGEDLFFKNSYCPKCNKRIRFFSLIPIFSWIFQCGKCSNCKNKISFRYPLIEIITSILFILSYISFGYSLNTIIIDLVLVTCMIMIVTDLEEYIIPNSTQISLFILGIIFIYYNKLDILYSVLSAFFYFLIIFISGFFVKKLKKKESVGGGDLKLIPIIGLYLGYSLLPYFFLISGGVGVIFGVIWKKFTKNDYFPFAPALIISFLILLLFKKLNDIIFII